MKIRIKVSGFKKGSMKFHKMAKNWKRVIRVALLDFGNEAAEELKKRARAGQFGPPKRWGSGPPLIKTGNYISSIRSVSKNSNTIEIKPTGSNRHMSNEVLGGLLEYGWQSESGGSPARPHWRWLGRWIETKGAKKLGKRLTEELFK